MSNTVDPEPSTYSGADEGLVIVSPSPIDNEVAIVALPVVVNDIAP